MDQRKTLLTSESGVSSLNRLLVTRSLIVLIMVTFHVGRTLWVTTSVLKCPKAGCTVYGLYFSPKQLA